MGPAVLRRTSGPFSDPRAAARPVAVAGDRQLPVAQAATAVTVPTTTARGLSLVPGRPLPAALAGTDRAQHLTHRDLLHGPLRPVVAVGAAEAAAIMAGAGVPAAIATTVTIGAPEVPAAVAAGDKWISGSLRPHKAGKSGNSAFGVGGTKERKRRKWLSLACVF